MGVVAAAPGAVGGSTRSVRRNMAFSLTIHEGQDVGRQFSFNRPEATVGRTAENDVVLDDAGVSRKHVLIRAEGSRYFARDLGSSNGTLLNGDPIAEEELHSGDMLTVGPVALLFEVSSDTSRVNGSGPAPRPSKPVALARRPQPASPAKPIRPAAPPARRQVTGPLAPQGKEGKALTAAERARLKRQATGLSGKLRLFLADKPPTLRAAIVGGGALVALLLLVGLVKALWPGPAEVSQEDQSKSVFELTDQVSQAIYGLGDLVTVPTRNELHFRFVFLDTLPRNYYLAFEAAGVETKGEVDITLNLHHIADVNPNLGEIIKEQRVRLPRKFLKPGENEIVFDHTGNPPGQKPWAIANARLVVEVRIECQPADCMSEAQKAYKQAEERLAMKDIAARNRYDAWMFLKRAMAYLEAIPPPPPDLLPLVQQTLREVSKDLDVQCNKIMLGAKKFEEHGQLDRTLKAYKDGLGWFQEDHPCYGRIQEMIENIGEPGTPAQPGQP